MTFALPPKQQSPLDYTGFDFASIPGVQFPRAPLPQDIHYPLFTIWRNSNPNPTAPDATGDAWLLSRFNGTIQPYQAVWIKLAQTFPPGSLNELTPDSGGAVTPIGNNINLHGVGNLTTTNGGAGQINLNLTGLTQHDVLVGGVSNAITSVSPSTAGFVLTSNGVGADPSFQVAPGGGSITSITGNSGGAEVPLAGNFNIVGTGSVTVAGSANTETISLTGITQFDVLVGGATNTIVPITPGPVNTVLRSKGNAANPAYSTNFKISNADVVTNSAQPCFSATKTAGSVAVTGDGTVFQIIFNSTSFDQAGNYDNSTGVFTAPITGKYFFTAGVETANNSGTNCNLEIRTTSNTYVLSGGNWVVTSATANFWTQRGSIIADMTAGDTAFVTVTCSGGAKTTDVQGSANFITSFMGYLLC